MTKCIVNLNVIATKKKSVFIYHCSRLLMSYFLPLETQNRED